MFVFGHIGLTLFAFYLAEQWLSRLQGKVNYGFMAIGALLPDLIDKPLGRFYWQIAFQAAGYLSYLNILGTG